MSVLLAHIFYTAFSFPAPQKEIVFYTAKKPPLREALHSLGGDTQNRTGDKGFADLGLTTWLCRRYGAENEARTRDPHLGKVVLYH